MPSVYWSSFSAVASRAAGAVTSCAVPGAERWLAVSQQLLLGTKTGRQLGGDALKLGGMAAVGALAYKAWRDWQASKAPAQAAEPERKSVPLLPAPAGTLQSVNETGQQRLARHLLRAMIAAAKSDGHVDAQEQARIFGEMDKLSLSSEDKAFVMDELRAKLDIDAVSRCSILARRSRRNVCSLTSWRSTSTTQPSAAISQCWRARLNARRRAGRRICRQNVAASRHQRVSALLVPKNRDKSVGRIRPASVERRLVRTRPRRSWLLTPVTVRRARRRRGSRVDAPTWWLNAARSCDCPIGSRRRPSPRALCSSPLDPTLVAAVARGFGVRERWATKKPPERAA